MEKIPTTSTTLLRDVASDSQHARWTEFATRYRPMMEAYLRERFPSADADDVIQETLVAVWAALPSYRYAPDEKGHFHNYLTGILRNKALRQLSNGQKNQFEVILALSQGADYILMDEPFAGNDMFNREDFYKVLLGILEDHETVLLSTHLLEEVASFISRTVLLRQGSIIGDMSTEAMDEKGISLTDYVKEIYHYQRDRVRRILEEQDDA